jgi:hypothetical protein
LEEPVVVEVEEASDGTEAAIDAEALSPSTSEDALE